MSSRFIFVLVWVMLMLWVSTANAGTLMVKINGVENGKPIAEENAFCIADGNGKTHDGGNVSPGVTWSGAPSGTKSFAVIVVDPDVPANFDNANKEGRTIPASASRRNFYHWLVVDIPPDTTVIPSGAPRPPGKVGQNDFGSGGKGAGGYDGPCPPWNDERLHHYHFIVYALDVPMLSVGGNFKGKEAQDAMQGHILATGEVVGTYSTNPKFYKTGVK